MTLRRYHAPVWDEPIIMEMGAPGRRGQHFPRVEGGASRVPAALRRANPPALPENSEPDVLRHYLRLSQETMGMIGISLFGTAVLYSAAGGSIYTPASYAESSAPAAHLA